jgi:hypothetical protein
MAFPLFLGFRYQNYTGKAIFMPLSIGVGIEMHRIIFPFIDINQGQHPKRESFDNMPMRASIILINSICFFA